MGRGNPATMGSDREADSVVVRASFWRRHRRVMWWGGWKGMLLTPLDRHFEKNGAGTEIQIHIKGTREQPEFGVDFGRMKGSSREQRQS
jgi:hypothetical protein